MNTYNFKTNINCGGCIKGVTPALNGSSAISSWHVDTENPDKILTVATDTLSEPEVINLVKEAGFEAQSVAGS